jgi:molecular chaperone DnaJ
VDKFKEVTAAYEVLSDDKQRQRYDQFGPAGVDPNFQEGNPFGAGGNPFGGGSSGGFDFGDGSFHFTGGSGNGAQINPEELFEAFFGGGSRRPRGPRRGADLQMHVELTFEEAVFGTSKDLNLRYQILNQKTGQIEIMERQVTVDTPPGIDNGMNLRLSGQGAEGDPGAPRGNLLVQVLVDPHEYYMREGADVHTEAPISITQAILGGSIDIKTLNGEVEVKIPKGCQPDTKLMLRGKGIQKMHAASKGNHIVHVRIEIPKAVTPRQEALLREFDEEAKEHGIGISGRIAKAAESAFESIFGKNKEKGDNAKKSKKSKKTEPSQDDQEREKKTA